MSSKLDDVCKKILISLSSTPLRLAQLQRIAGIGSARTVHRHIPHLIGLGLVVNEWEEIGVKRFSKIYLTDNGIKEKEKQQKIKEKDKVTEKSRNDE